MATDVRISELERAASGDITPDNTEIVGNVDGITKRIVLNQLSGFMGGAGTYTNLTPVPATLGGISSGQTFDETPISDVFDMLLYPYLTPSFASFAINVSSPLEVGYAVSGTKQFSWSISNVSNVQADSISISCATNGTLGTGISLTSPTSLSVGSPVTKTSPSSNTWTISAINTNSQTFSRTTSVAWQYRKYYGESANTSLTEAQIKALQSGALSTSYAQTYSFPLGLGYKYMVWPVSFGTPSSFKLGGFEVAMESPTTISITNSYGVTASYYVYRTTNVLNGTNLEIVVT